MGNSGNRQTPGSILEQNDLASIAKYMKSDKCRKVFLMLGAGVSTSAGIPDFRSPDTGLYANLARLKLPFPEAVFEINFFRRNPIPFYTLANELYPGRFRPTQTHSFIKLLADRKLLHTCFTQNIDTLERIAGVPAAQIVEAHGSFATQRCIECKAPFDGERMREMVMDKAIPRCAKCKGLVKPDIVFFGEALPESFHRSIPSLREADLLIIIGTSLTVHPFASLAEFVPESCPRLLINLERVGGIGRKKNDVVCVGKCDDVILDLCSELGWRDELTRLWKKTEYAVKGEHAPADEPEDKVSEKETEAEDLKDRVDELTEEIGRALQLQDEKDGKDKRASNAEATSKTDDTAPSASEPKESEGKAPAPESTTDEKALQDIAAEHQAKEIKDGSPKSPYKAVDDYGRL